MACRGRCFWANEHADNVHVFKHEQLIPRGVVYKYHAFRVHDASEQPTCGECAVLYFHRSPKVHWMRKFDIDAVMSDQVYLMSEVDGDVEAILQEIRVARQIWGLE
ncbi:hypothetical protein E4U41_004976 [Claviceps citrina]|nr:hypothetical protein E4U41_004976 [Claviceps citrina]